MSSIETDTAWAAGLFEGEGIINIVDNSVRISIQMTDRDVLENMQRIFGGKIYSCKKQKSYYKDSWRWTVSRTSEAQKILTVIRPYMGQRRQRKIDEALEVISNNRTVKYLAKISEIKRLRETGMTHKQIADKLGIHRTAVSHALGKSGRRAMEKA